MGKPRNLNIVSVFLLLVVVAVGYLGWKLVPVAWQAASVDAELSAVQFEASTIRLSEYDPREEQLLERLRQAILELGVQDQRLTIYFSPDYTSVHADYWTEVEFLFNYRYRFDFQRSEEIPRDEDY